jgi:hypothetical protein
MYHRSGTVTERQEAERTASRRFSRSAFASRSWSGTPLSTSRCTSATHARCSGSRARASAFARIKVAVSRVAARRGFTTWINHASTPATPARMTASPERCDTDMPSRLLMPWRRTSCRGDSNPRPQRAECGSATFLVRLSDRTSCSSWIRLTAHCRPRPPLTSRSRTDRARRRPAAASRVQVGAGHRGSIGLVRTPSGHFPRLRR